MIQKCLTLFLLKALQNGAGMWIGICCGIIAVIFAGDMWIKNRIEEMGVEGETKEVFGGRLLLRKYHNTGAALNLGSRKRALVAGVSVALTALVFILFLLTLGKRGNNLLKVGLSFLLGGAFSNTYDRLKRKYVVDYVSFGVKWKRLRGIVFNISDFCIITGALLTALGSGR